MNDRGLRIYIAGPYSAETEALRLRNVKAAIDAGFQLFSKGHYPYIPHLTHFIDLRAHEIGHFLSWDDYIEWDLPWVELCDALLYLNSSRGADLELKRARELGKQIFYSVAEVPDIHDEGSSISLSQADSNTSVGP